jgi:hypothetical protein
MASGPIVIVRPIRDRGLGVENDPRGRGQRARNV